MTAEPRTPVDQAERDRIATHGLAETLFVQAGAGSGKTTALVRRVVSLVLESGVRLSSIAAITFTEAAASELQARIRASFERALASAESAGDDERARRCSDALADLDLAAISTLHGFANRILAEFAVAAQLPPEVRVLDEVASQLAHEQRWQRFVDHLYDLGDHDLLLAAADVLGIPLEPRAPSLPSLRSVAVEFDQNWDRIGELTTTAPPGIELPDFSGVDAALDELAVATRRCTDHTDRLFMHVLDLVAEVRAMLEVPDELPRFGLLRARGLNNGWKTGNKGQAPNWGGADSVAEVRALVMAVKEAIDADIEPVVDRCLEWFRYLIALDVVEAAHERRREGGLEFHDLLVLARNMLRTDDEARAALHERYRHLLLDEFQDTDPIQIELAVLIATSADRVAELAWPDLPVEPGRLFFVGDPKQSIYRFRRADIALYLDARDRFGAEDAHVDLVSNFRSVEPVVDFVNHAFSAWMPAEVAGAQPAYQPLAAVRTPVRPELHRPVRLGAPHPDPKVTAAALRTAEAEDVARAVDDIVQSGDAWPVYDEAADEWRAARLDDITILLPTRTSLSFLRRALDDRGIRYRIATGTLVYETQEVVDALAALRSISDPSDELSLVATLRSPLYGCSDVDLFAWRSAGGRWDYRHDGPGDAAPVVAAAMVHLRGLWAERWFLTPSTLLERLLRERSAPMLAFGDPRPTDVWRRLRFLVEQARTFEESVAGDLRAFTEWAALQGGSMARVHEPLLPETDERSLSIQTMHGAKGLEFPITILSGMTTRPKTGQNRPTVLWGDDGDAPTIRIKSGVAMAGHQPRADLESEMDEYERTRLAYVAMTRARDHLIVSCHHKHQASRNPPFGALLFEYFAAAEQLGLARTMPEPRDELGGSSDPAPPADQLGLALDDRQHWLEHRTSLFAPHTTSRVFSATGIAQAALGLDPAAGLPEGAHDQRDDRSDSPTDTAPGRRGRTGTAVGSAVHAVLQHLDLARPTGIAALVDEQCQLEGIPDHTQVVGRLVEAALGSDAIMLAAAHPHHKELFVAAPVDDRVIEGYVDLLIDTPAGLVVVDYKTDAVSTDADVDAKVELYELQAAAYAVALESVLERSVVECRFVFCRSGGAVERSVADLDDAKRRVRATIGWSPEGS